MKLANKEYPYKDENGNLHYNLIKHYSENGYKILQYETGEKYGEAIDLYPCKYTYYETDEPIEEEVAQDDSNT